MYFSDLTAHANVLIYRKNLNQIEHFEPHGRNFSIDQDDINNKIIENRDKKKETNKNLFILRNHIDPNKFGSIYNYNNYTEKDILNNLIIFPKKENIIKELYKIYKDRGNGLLNNNIKSTILININKRLNGNFNINLKLKSTHINTLRGKDLQEVFVQSAIESLQLSGHYKEF